MSSNESERGDGRRDQPQEESLIAMLPQQKQPPAGHEGILATRPACHQTTRVDHPDRSASYTITFQGQPYTLHTFTAPAPTSGPAIATLGSMGICVAGDVPAVDMLPAGAFVQGVSSSPPVNNVAFSEPPLVPIVVGIAIALIALAAWMYSRPDDSDLAWEKMQ